MNESAELDRLISRFLDDECSADERRVLRRTLRDDPAAAALYEEYTALDREVGHAMRSALGRHTDRPVGRSVRRWLSQLVGLAAAASLVALVWVEGPRRGASEKGPAHAASHSNGWFRTNGLGIDSTRPNSLAYDRPHIPVHQTARDWILIPGEHPGEFMVIEVDRVRTRAIGIHEDF